MFWPVLLSQLGQDTSEPGFLARDADGLRLSRRKLVLTNRARQARYLTSPPDKQALSRNCPWVCSSRESVLVLGLASVCALNSGLTLAFTRLLSPCSPGSPVFPGPAPARPLSPCRLAPAVFSARVCSSPLPGPTLQHRLSPALSLGFSLGSPHRFVSLECLLSLQGLVRGGSATGGEVPQSAGMGIWWQELLGGSGVCPPGSWPHRSHWSVLI